MLSVKRLCTLGVIFDSVKLLILSVKTIKHREPRELTTRKSKLNTPLIFTLNVMQICDNINAVL